MHVAFLSSEYPGLQTGGIGTSIRELGRALVCLGHRVTVVGWGPRTNFDDNGISVRFLGSTKAPKLGWILNRRKAWKELNRLVHEEDLDIIEASDWCGLSAGMRTAAPIVIRCHGSATYFAHLLGDRVRPTVRLAERLALAQAASVASVSSFTSERTGQLFGLSRAIRCIPNAVDLSRFSPGNSNHSDPLTVVYLGTLVRKKGVLDLCKAFSLMLHTVPDARLKMIGRDSADPYTGSSSTWELCKGLLSPDALSRTDYIRVLPHDEVQLVLQAATVCAFPSYAEAMPLTWIEALACGKALVVYDIGWAREVVGDGEAGLLVRPGDCEGLAAAMAELLTHDSLRGRLAAEARRRAEKEFSIDLLCQRTLDWYDETISLGGKRIGSGGTKSNSR